MRKLSLTLLEVGSALLIMFVCFFVIDIGERWILHTVHLKGPDETLNFASQIFIVFVLYQNTFQITRGKLCERAYPLSKASTVFLLVTAVVLFIAGVVLNNI